MYYINDTVYYLDGYNDIVRTAIIKDISNQTDTHPQMYLCEFEHGPMEWLAEYEIRHTETSYRDRTKANDDYVAREQRFKRMPDDYFDFYFPEFEDSLVGVLDGAVKVAKTVVDMEDNDLHSNPYNAAFNEGLYAGMHYAIRAITGMDARDWLVYQAAMRDKTNR